MTTANKKQLSSAQREKVTDTLKDIMIALLEATIIAGCYMSTAEDVDDYEFVHPLTGGITILCLEKGVPEENRSGCFTFACAETDEGTVYTVKYYHAPGRSEYLESRPLPKLGSPR